MFCWCLRFVGLGEMFAFHFLSSHSYRIVVMWSGACLAHLVSSLPSFWQTFFGDLFTPVGSSSIPYKYLPQNMYPGLDLSLSVLLGVGEKTYFPQPHANLGRMQTQRRQQCSRSTFLTNRSVFTCRQFMAMPRSRFKVWQENRHKRLQ